MKKNSGVTLIEILLAIIVMVVGLVGILALFPPSLQNTKASVEESHAAILAESVQHAITVGMGAARWDPMSSKYIIPFTHDFKTGTLGNLIEISLPKTTEPWTHYPGGTSLTPDTGIPAGTDPEKSPVFLMNADVWVNASVADVVNKTDQSESLNQFAFSFDIQKMNTLTYAIPAPPDLEQRCRLYSVRIFIFRKQVYSAAGGAAEAPGAATGVGGTNILIKALECRISVR